MTTTISYTVTGLISSAPIVSSDYFTEPDDGTLATPVPRDIKVDTVTGALSIENGDLVVVSGLESIQQELILRLQFFQKDWFLDLQAGLPYWEQILEKLTDVGIIKQLYQQEIEATPGVKLVKSLDVRVDSSTRTLYVDFVVSTDLGELTISNFASFEGE